MRKHTPADARNDLLLLGEYESEGGPSLRELAAREGQSHVHVWRRLERARAYRQRWRDEELIREAVRKGDLPHVEITSGRIDEYHYNLRHDQHSRLPGGVFTIGTGNGYIRVAHALDGQDLVKSAQSKKKSRAKAARTKLLTREEVDAIKAKYKRPRKRKLIDTQ